MRMLAILAAVALCVAATPALAQARGPQPTAERPVLLVDQVRSAPFPQELMPLFGPLKTLEQVEAVLRTKGVKFERGPVFVDARTANPQVVKLIANLPPGEIFIIPQNGFITFSRVVSALTPAEASAMANPPKPPAST